MFEHHKISIGISPLNWINDDMPSLGFQNNFEQILSEIALTGYSGTEKSALLFLKIFKKYNII